MAKLVKKQNLANNFIFQFLYQALILIIPLIVSPYLTRCMGDTALGTYTYVNSIAYYFVLFANLGISRHGQRIIAQSKSDAIQLRKNFWSLYTLHAAISLIAVISYIVFFSAIYKGESRSIYLITSLYVFSALFDVTWLFYGLEYIKSVVIKNALIKIIECAAIFTFVHSPDDLWIYTLIVSSGFLFGQAVMIPQAIAMVKPVPFTWGDVKPHVKPLLVFSISVVAVTLYTVFDKTLLGIMTTKENVAYYEYANKIINIPRTFTTIIGTVLFPRACKLAAVGDVRGQRKYLKLSLTVVYFLGFASLFGLAAVSKLFVVIYYGETFAAAGGVMTAMCALPLIIGLGEILRAQYLIPNHKDKAYVVCIVLNAVVNLILSCLLIPVIGIYGAVVGTCCAELFGLIFQMVLCRKFIGILDLLKQMIPFAVIGAMMYGAVKFVSLGYNSGTFALLLQVGVGAAVYCILTVVYFVVFDRDMRDKICRLLSKRNS